MLKLFCTRHISVISIIIVVVVVVFIIIIMQLHHLFAIYLDDM